MARSIDLLAVRAEHASARRERIIMCFVIVQLFIVIYLQRIAVTTTISLPLATMLGGIGLGFALGWFRFADPYRVAAYTFLVGACLVSEAFAQGHIMSVLQLLAIYFCWTFTSPVSDGTYRRILNAFVIMMILPAIIIVVQFSYQKLTGSPNFITMTGLVPDSMVVKGFAYDYHYPWNSVFSRPNGFVFLEPSFASMFAATAAIIEISYFRRWQLVTLMIVATFTSMGVTGISMLFIAAPFLLVRERFEVVIATVLTGLAAITLVIALDIPLPLISRVDELDTRNSSGAERVLLPLERFGELLFDPSYILVGQGAGSDLRNAFTYKEKVEADPNKTSQAVASLWPEVKVLSEYGLISMIAYLILYGTAMRGRFNVPLKIALSVEFLATGGYLVVPPFTGLLLYLFLLAPPESAGVSVTKARRVRQK